jgi:hypothetical protein
MRAVLDEGGKVLSSRGESRGFTSKWEESCKGCERHNERR